MMPMPPAPRGQGMPLGNQPPQAPPGAMGMMQAEQPPGSAAMSDPTSLKNQFLMQIRQLVSQIDAMSTTFPAFAPFSEQMMQAAQDGMIQVVAALGAQEQPQSPMGMM